MTGDTTGETTSSTATGYTFAEYQVAAERTAHRAESETYDRRLANYALGLAGEAGECADALKKHLFHDKPLDRDAITKELGDCLWYLSTLASTLEIPLEEIAVKNVAKLKARYPEGFSTTDANARRDETEGNGA